jgi:thiamine biosynthesis lipoprotein
MKLSLHPWIQRDANDALTCCREAGGARLADQFYDHLKDRSPRLLLLLPLLLLTTCSRAPTLTTLAGETMGTTWSLRMVAPPAGLREEIQKHLDAREAVWSHWRADSALSRFNESGSTDWVGVPAELVRAVASAKHIADATDGALDVTVAPLVDLWGFGAQGTQTDPPGADAIKEAMARTGWRFLQWREHPPALRKAVPDLRINVAAVAEGLVIDELVALLRGRGLTQFLLEVGGEVAAAGGAPDGRPWRVGIQTPGAPGGEALQALPLTDQCMATSGTYRQGHEAAGQRVSHLIDPRTGRPVEHRLVSVTVIDASCARADAFATALLVLGPQRGRAVAERLGLNVFWIEAPPDD